MLSTHLFFGESFILSLGENSGGPLIPSARLQVTSVGELAFQNAWLHVTHTAPNLNLPVTTWGCGRGSHVSGALCTPILLHSLFFLWLSSYFLFFFMTTSSLGVGEGYLRAGGEFLTTLMSGWGRLCAGGVHQALKASPIFLLVDPCMDLPGLPGGNNCMSWVCDTPPPSPQPLCTGWSILCWDLLTTPSWAESRWFSLTWLKYCPQ